MKIPNYSFSVCLCLALAVAKQDAHGPNSLEDLPQISEKDFQNDHNLPKVDGNVNAVDWGSIDDGDGGVNEKVADIPVVSPELGTQYDDIDEGYETDWDKLEHDDEYVFTRNTRSVPKVPKNTKASDDIFYHQPTDIGTYAPGTVIRMREVTPETYPENVKNVYQYMVRSTDSLGQPVGIVSTVYVSSKGLGDKLLSFQVPTDSPCIDCAPSVDMADSMKKLEKPLAYGWNVIAPDFQGLNGAFGAARLAGQAVLDSVRGVLSTGKITGISPDSKFAIWGYSGGSIATGWAATLQPQYAPELTNQLVGAAVGGWITDYDSTIEAADGKLAAGLVGLALNGLAQQYTELVPIYKKYIRNAIKLKAILFGTKQVCLTLGVFRFLGAQFFKGPRPYFQGGEKALREPAVRKIIEDNRVAFRRETGMPECPLFLHHALKDNIAPLADTKRVVHTYCDWGIRSFEVNFVKATGHMSESRDGVPAVVAWIRDRFDGIEPVKGCQEKTWETLKEYPGIDKTYFKRDDTGLGTTSMEDLMFLDETDFESDFVRLFLPLA
ncbi:Secretory lipase [Metschnikowia aff. pulcherrima]|uniref:Secretory lipase n=1 Tax=Metschnikowia aff. pulcherrima TaxID=2163413 RepID=A0A4P6XVI6_9ASCO|nr:Secretory lipase [Metschnikowia aff. pulcherrima]